MVGTAMHSRLVAEGKGGSAMRTRRELLHVVERRPAHRHLLPQHDRHSDRDHRQPDADAIFRWSPDKQLPQGDWPHADRAAGVALPAVDRIRDDATIAPCWTWRRAIARRCCSTSTGWGRTRSRRAAAITGPSRPSASRRWKRLRRPRSGCRRRTRWTRRTRRRSGGSAGSRRRRSGRRRTFGGARARFRRTCTTRCCTIPKLRDPRGYIIPSDQADFPTATKFVNALLKNGITVHAGDGRVSRWRARAIRRARTW